MSLGTSTPPPRITSSTRCCVPCCVFSWLTQLSKPSSTAVGKYAMQAQGLTLTWSQSRRAHNCIVPAHCLLRLASSFLAAALETGSEGPACSAAGCSAAQPQLGQQFPHQPPSAGRPHHPQRCRWRRARPHRTRSVDMIYSLSKIHGEKPSHSKLSWIATCFDKEAREFSAKFHHLDVLMLVPLAGAVR